MPTCTVGYTLNNKPDARKVLNTVKKTLKKLGAEDIKIVDQRGYYTIDFSYLKDASPQNIKASRTIFLGFHYDHDYTDTPQKKIVYSLNKWGSAEIIISAICLNMRQFGETYFAADDSNDNFVRV